MIWKSSCPRSHEEEEEKKLVEVWIDHGKQFIIRDRTFQHMAIYEIV
jgi:hypothetical protein